MNYSSSEVKIDTFGVSNFLTEMLNDSDTLSFNYMLVPWNPKWRFEVIFQQVEGSPTLLHIIANEYPTLLFFTCLERKYMSSSKLFELEHE